MSDNRKYFHWNKQSLIKECCKLADRVEELEADLREVEAQLDVAEFWISDDDIEHYQEDWDFKKKEEQGPEFSSTPFLDDDKEEQA